MATRDDGIDFSSFISQKDNKKMKKLILIFICGGLATLVILKSMNYYRISNYEKFIIEAKGFKNGPEHFPWTLPEQAFSKEFYYLGDGYCLKFKLSDENLVKFRAELVSEYKTSSKNKSNYRPPIDTAGCEEILWNYFDGNHGTARGIWYKKSENLFIFYHGSW